jgi:Apea-like HEPN
VSHRTLSREVVSLLSSDAGSWIGFAGEGFRAFKRIATGLHRLPPVEAIATAGSVEQSAFAWVKTVIRGSTTLGLTDFVANAIESRVRQYRVVIPVADLFFDGEFAFGGVTFRTFPKHLLDEFERSAATLAGDDADAHRAHTRELREHFQGRAAVETSVSAEQDRAKEIAMRRAETAIGILRLFAPSHVDSTFGTFWAPWDHHPKPRQFVFFCDAAGQLTSITDEFLADVSSPAIDGKTLALMKELGLDAFQRILDKPLRSEFEDTVLSASIQFGEAALIRELHTRLVVYCVALERVLLKSSTEPITQNLRERLALFVRDNLGERAEVLRTVRDAYAIRSRYVHHGARSDDLITMSEFSRLGLQFFLKAAKNSNRFASTAAFLDHLDALKMSGGPA